MVTPGWPTLSKAAHTAETMAGRMIASILFISKLLSVTDAINYLFTKARPMPFLPHFTKKMKRLILWTKLMSSVKLISFSHHVEADILGD
jgi:hypothetical protein